MAVAVDPKPARKRLDQFPRPVRKKLKPAPLLNDPALAVLLFGDEKQYREQLFRDFVKFCRDAGAWVISSPLERVCRVQMPDGSPLLERLAQLPRFPVVKLPNVSQRIQGGRFIETQEIEVELWR
jgi:hypothetical protein